MTMTVYATAKSAGIAVPVITSVTQRRFGRIASRIQQSTASGFAIEKTWSAVMTHLYAYAYAYADAYVYAYTYTCAHARTAVRARAARRPASAIPAANIVATAQIPSCMSVVASGAISGMPRSA